MSYGSKGKATIPLLIGSADLQRLQVLRGESTTSLTPTEARLLCYFAENPGRPLPHRELLGEVWGYSDSIQTRTLYSTVNRLRSKIEREPTQPDHILAVPRVGYRFEPMCPTGNLPESTPVLGREDERAEIQAALASGARLLTLIGTAGIGKTTLATAAGHDLGGAWMVSLIGCTGLAEILWKASETLGLSSKGGSSTVSQLGEAIQQAGMTLLILDNAEQAREAVAEVARSWLEAAPKLRILVTSRVGLGAPGERTLAVRPLAAEAGRSLFLRRAGAAHADHPALAAVVARTGGIPLVIELASTMTDVLSLTALLERLGSPMLTLAESRSTSGDSLQEALARSWRLLNKEEQRFLADVAVFNGPFHVEAAEAVAQCPGRGPILLKNLLRKSLLYPRRIGTTPRFELYVSVRSFARSAHPDLTAARQRHARWFARWSAEQVTPPVALEPVMASQADLLEAFRFAAAAGLPEVADLGESLDTCFIYRPAPTLQAEVLLELVARAPTPQRHCEALRRSSRAARRRGDMAAAAADIEAMFDAVRSEEMPRWRACAHRDRGILATMQGRPWEALPDLRAALAGYQAIGDDPGVARSWLTIGDTYREAGEPTAAAEALEEALARYRHCGSALSVAIALSSLSDALWWSGSRDRSSRTLEECWRRSVDLGHRGLQSVVQILRAGQALSSTDPDSAMDHIIHAEKLIRQSHAAHQPVAHGLRGWLSWRQGDDEEAAASFRLAELGYAARGARSSETIYGLYRHALRRRLPDHLTVHTPFTDTVAWSLGVVFDLPRQPPSRVPEMTTPLHAAAQAMLDGAPDPAAAAGGRPTSDQVEVDFFCSLIAEKAGL